MNSLYLKSPIYPKLRSSTVHLVRSRKPAREHAELHLDRRLSDPRKLLERNVGLKRRAGAKEAYSGRASNRRRTTTLSLDEGKIAQVLNNLISNAIKFSQPETSVAVCAIAEGEYQVLQSVVNRELGFEAGIA